MENPEEKLGDFRKKPRPNHQKAFAFHELAMKVQTNVERAREYPDFQDAEFISRVCHMYAASYTATIMGRVKNEDPDYFKDNE